MTERHSIHPAVELRGIVKRFPGVTANDRVDLIVRRGEIHCLLGENGAGKTTLMKILYGLYQPDAGEIYLGGNPTRIASPKAALAYRIGMVHQHFHLVPTLTVEENIVLGLAEGTGPFLNPRKTRRKIARLAQEYGLEVDATAKVWQLTVGQQQRVEILKALYRDADTLIMDEPTSVLTPQEVDGLFGTLRTLVNDGLTIIFITHKLDEVMEISDQVTVLRARGRWSLPSRRGRQTRPNWRDSWLGVRWSSAWRSVRDSPETGSWRSAIFMRRTIVGCRRFGAFRSTCGLARSSASRASRETASMSCPRFSRECGVQRGVQRYSSRGM